MSGTSPSIKAIEEEDTNEALCCYCAVPGDIFGPSVIVTGKLFIAF